MLRVAIPRSLPRSSVEPLVLPNFAGFLSQLSPTEQALIQTKFSLAEGGNIGEAGRILDKLKTAYPSVEHKLHAEFARVITNAKSLGDSESKLDPATEGQAQALGQRVLAAVKMQVADEKGQIRTEVYEQLRLSPAQKALPQFSRDNPQFRRFLESACCNFIVQTLNSNFKNKELFLTHPRYLVTLAAIGNASIDSVPLDPAVEKLKKSTEALVDHRSLKVSAAVMGGAGSDVFASIAKQAREHKVSVVDDKYRLTGVVDKLVRELITIDPHHAPLLVAAAYAAQGDTDAKEQPLSATVIGELEDKGYLTGAVPTPVVSRATVLAVQLASLLAGEVNSQSSALWGALGAIVEGQSAFGHHLASVKRMDYSALAHDVIQEVFRHRSSTMSAPSMSISSGPAL